MPQPKRAGRHDADWTLEDYQASNNLRGAPMSTFEALWKGFAVLLIPLIIILPLFNAIGLHAVGIVVYLIAIGIGFMTLGELDRKR